MSDEIRDELRDRRPVRQSDQGFLFDLPDPGEDYWTGMPSFEMKDCQPGKRVTVNFMTREDYLDFQRKLGIRLSHACDTMWWPTQERLGNSEFEWRGPHGVTTRYPICIPSKGRADVQQTGRRLTEMGVPHKFFVEETEAETYAAVVGEKNLVVMPFHDLGQGSIPARNFIWDWAKERGHPRHWIFDDNINMFTRCTLNRRLQCRTGTMFRAIEDFTDRYDNVAFAGPHDQGFVPDRVGDVEPVLWNSRVYSCTLINTTLPYRWRGRYNEDTDICLRALKDGWVTIVFRALLMNKMATMTMKGGNTDTVYDTGDHRREFAESLKRQHPDVVKVVERFGRWHHMVDYAPFRKNEPVLREGFVHPPTGNEYEMELVRTKGGGA